MEVLASRVLLRASDPDRSRGFYRDVLGLAVYREFPNGMVFFLGGGFLEVSGRGDSRPTPNLALWLQVRDLYAEHDRLAALGVDVLRPPQREPWGLIEMWVADPDGVRVVLVEVPEGHPLRQDLRSTPSPESN